MKISYKKFQKISQTVWNKCLSKWVVIGIQLPIMQRNFSCHLLHIPISIKSLWYVCIYSSGYIYFIIGYCCQYHEWNFRWYTIHSNSMKPSVRNRLFLLELLASEVPKPPKCSSALGDAPELDGKTIAEDITHVAQSTEISSWHSPESSSLLPNSPNVWRCYAHNHQSDSPSSNPGTMTRQATGLRGECTTASVLDGHCRKLAPN